MQYGICSRDFVTKSVEKTKNTIVYGYAAVHAIKDLDNDIFSKNAFTNLNVSKVKFLWQHDHTKPIGRINLLARDEYGLKMEAEINNDVAIGKEASSLIKQGALSGLSIGFKTLDSSFNSEGQRVIEEIELYEVSVVTFPANKHAQIEQVKSCKNNSSLHDRIRDLENFEQGIDRIVRLIEQA